LKQSNKNQPIVFLFILLVGVLVLAACDEAPTRTPFVPPTPPPTPAAYDSVKPAATVDTGNQLPANNTAAATPNNLPTQAAEGLNLPDDDFGRGFSGENPDPTTLAQLFGTPGASGSRTAPPNSLVAPTPTLNFTSSQLKLSSLRISKFLFAYRQASTRIQDIQAQARLVFASANAISDNRVAWNFFFVWLNGNRAWRVQVDIEGQNQPKVNLSEQAPSMLADYNTIDMNRVIDGDELVSRAESAGVRTNLPVQVINFGLDGTTRQPAFMLTNTAQGKQLVLHAYTGQVIRNEFG
jgi:hypothetical protein